MRELKKDKQIPVSTVLARNQRKCKNPLEAKLWMLLRDRRLGGLKFRRQQPVGSFVLDFYCPRLKLAIELDGSGHARATTSLKDTERDKILRSLGIKVIRFWNSELIRSEEAVLERILEVAAEIREERSE